MNDFEMNDFELPGMWETADFEGGSADSFEEDRNDPGGRKSRAPLPKERDMITPEERGRFRPEVADAAIEIIMRGPDQLHSSAVQLWADSQRYAVEALKVLSRIAAQPAAAPDARELEPGEKLRLIADMLGIEEGSIPTSAFLLINYLDSEGDDSFSHATFGEPLVSQMIGSIWRAMHDLDHLDVESEEPDEE